MERGSTMNLEKDIPDYAMVPAKEVEENILKPITNEAIFSSVGLTNVSDGQKLTFVIEEDVLVPDIKADLKEILIMEGSCNLSTREINNHTKEDDLINISGELCIQTLYVPEKPNPLCPIIPIETKIPFKEQCKLNVADTIILNCNIEQIDYIIVNERKYRVKATVAICTKEYRSNTLNLFDGLREESLHVLREKVVFSTLSQRKKDILSIKEYISPISDSLPGQLLIKDIHVMENYRQVTADKIVLNGYIGLNILYCEKSPINDSNLRDNLHQIQEKVEFTQFIPLQNAKDISDCKLTFDASGLRLKICQHEDGQDIIQLEGDIITYVELYKRTEKDVIVDGYHKEKNFVCQHKDTEIKNLVGSCNSESSVREIFVPQKLSSDVENIIFTTGHIKESSHYFEQGKIITEGIILAKIVCQLSGEECEILTLEEDIPFRIISSIGNLTGDEEIHQEVTIRDFWSEKINGKQLEFNASLTAQTDATKTSSFVQLINPAFQIGSSSESTSPMVIYCCRKKDTLWQIAKKYKTAKETIMDINNLEKEELVEGQKLLIVK